MFLPHTPTEQQDFEITDRPYYSPFPRRQPMIEYNFKHNEDLATDFVEPHSYPKLNI
jgi:hypothetical protein